MQSISHAFIVTRHDKAEIPHHNLPSLDLCTAGKAPASRTDTGGRSHPGGASAPGLDSSQTCVRPLSPSPFPTGSFLVDPKANKLKRCKFATLTSARLHMAEVPGWTATFVGVTYAPGNAYKPRHITDFVKRLRAWCHKHSIDCRYLWVAEMQKRGAIHYHMLVFHPKRLSFPKPDKSGMWPHGSSNRRTGVRHAVAYMAKYMSKGDFAAFPKGARTYGSGGLKGTAKLEMRWWKLPTWVRQVVGMDDPTKRVVGGFRVHSTGEVLPCPYEVIFKGGCVFVRLKSAAG